MERKTTMTNAERKALETAMYFDFKALVYDPIELAQMEWKKNGGKVTVLPYRKARKAERLVRVGVKN